MPQEVHHVGFSPEDDEVHFRRRSRAKGPLDPEAIRVVASRHHILKCMPDDSEASAVLIGSVNFLREPIMAFVRLSEARDIGDVIEVPLPIKFLFLMMGPPTEGLNYYEIGRAISTLLDNTVCVTICC